MRKPHYTNPIDGQHSNNHDTDNQPTEIISKSNTLGPDAMAGQIFDEDNQTFLMDDYEQKKKEQNIERENSGSDSLLMRNDEDDVKLE